jgi:hypothetical protein
MLQQRRLPQRRLTQQSTRQQHRRSLPARAATLHGRMRQRGERPIRERGEGYCLAQVRVTGMQKTARSIFPIPNPSRIRNALLGKTVDGLERKRQRQQPAGRMPSHGSTNCCCSTCLCDVCVSC